MPASGRAIASGGVIRSAAQVLFHAVCRTEQVHPEDYRERDRPKALESSREFLRRMGGRLDVRGRSVLEVGCGSGALAVVLARQGAKAVHGVDINRSTIEFARDWLGREAPDVAGTVTYEAIGSFDDLRGRRFDAVVSKDSFEHLDDPEGFIRDVDRHIEPGGLLAVGFSPLWKSPYGGHLWHMTRFPWAHLVFPEKVIMLERRRFSVGEWDRAMRFEDTTGGLNRMTYARFTGLMASTGYRRLYWATNVKPGSRTAALMGALRRVPALREYMTISVYGIWQKPAEPGMPQQD